MKECERLNRKVVKWSFKYQHFVHKIARSHKGKAEAKKKAKEEKKAAKKRSLKQPLITQRISVNRAKNLKKLQEKK